MQARWFGVCGFLLVACLGLSTATGQEGKKRPIPPADAQAKVVKLIQELYGDELTKAATDPTVKLRLARTLLQEGRDTIDDAAGRYVLLREAHKLAAEAGDVVTALQASEELAQSFAIPPAELFRVRIATLSTAAAAKQAPPEMYQLVVDSALLLLDETLDADDFAASLALLDAADKAALRLRNVGLLASIRKREEEVRALRKEYARWEPFAEQLKNDPKDADANYEMGYYLALLKGNWDKGLPMLARGKGQAALAANLELRHLMTESLLDAAEHWYKFAVGVKGLPRINGLLHAYQLYLKQLPSANDAQRKTIEGRLTEINVALPVEYRAGEITTELRRIDSPQGPVYDAAFSPDGHRIICAAYDGSLRLWNARSGKELRRLDGHLGKVWSVGFHPDGRHVVSGGFDGSVRLWDLAVGQEQTRFPGHTDYVRSVTVSADGKRIVSGGDDRMVRVWGIESGKQLHALSGHDHTVWCVALSRNGRYAVSGSLDKTVRVWDVETGEALKKLEGHHDTVLGVCFAPDDRHVLSGSTDKTLILWDLEDGKRVRTFTGHTGYVQHVAMSPDGRYALSAGADQTVRLWDVATGKQLRVLAGHSGPVWSVSFSRDGRLALSTGQDHTVRIWGASR
jgi:hypothetical protein